MEYSAGFSRNKSLSQSLYMFYEVKDRIMECEWSEWKIKLENMYCNEMRD